ncbi:MAG: hypothetical protein Q8P73_03285 [bacterium]|nr:hypothetical protein [bacterium]
MKKIYLYLLIVVASVGITLVVDAARYNSLIETKEKEDLVRAQIRATPLSEPVLAKSFRPLSDPVDVSFVPSQLWEGDDFLGQKVIKGEHDEFYFLNATGQYSKIVYYDHPVSSVKLAPKTYDKIGFYYYPDGDSLKDVALVIMDNESGKTKEVYRNDIRTSRWEWDGSDRVIVYYSCGNMCMYAYKIDVNTGKTVDEYHVITGSNT